MPQITNGTIFYERVVKDADYGVNRKASASLSFSVENPDDYAKGVTNVMSEVVKITHQILSGKTPVSVGTVAPPATGGATPAPQPTGSNPVPATPEQIAAAAKAKEAAAYAMNKEDGKGPTEAPKPPRGPGRPKKETTAPAADPLAEMTGSPVQPAASETVQGSVAASTDPLADLGAEASTDELDAILGSEDAPAPVVTDADLSKAITKKAGELKDGPRIRELANKFGGGPLPKQLRDIPAGKRWAFIQELNALQPK